MKKICFFIILAILINITPITAKAGDILFTGASIADTYYEGDVVKGTGTVKTYKTIKNVDFSIFKDGKYITGSSVYNVNTTTYDFSCLSFSLRGVTPGTYTIYESIRFVNDDKRVLVNKSIRVLTGSNIWITDEVVPATLEEGKPFWPKGVLHSEYSMKSVFIGIYCGNKQLYSNTVYNKGTYFDISTPADLPFSKLPSGTYIFTVSARDELGNKFEVVHVVFTVKKNEFAQSGKTINYNGATYFVANGYQPEFAFKQTTSVNCTKTAGDICVSMYKGIYYRNTGWSNGCTWRDATTGKSIFKIGYARASAQVKLNKAAELIKNGVPSVLRLGTDKGHSVTVVGVRSDANLSNIKYSDLLVADPARGNIRVLQDISSASWWHGGVLDYDGNSTTEWGLYIPLESPSILTSGFSIR